MTKVTHLSVGGGSKSRSPQPHYHELVGDAEDAPLGTIGQVLRGARISRGEDIAAVSRVLKIRKDYLEALENDDLSRLPGRTYAVGFVRAYAEHLGLKSHEAVERFKGEIAGREDPSKTAGFPEPEEESGLSGGWWLFAIIVLALVGYGAYYLLTNSASSPPPSIAPVPAQMVEKPAVTHVQHTSPTSHAVTAPPPAATGAVKLDQHVYGAQNANARVVLRAIQPTHILVQSEDGTILINQVLHPGDTYRVPDGAGLSLTAEHGNAVELLLDGKSVGSAGPTADVAAAMSLDPDALSNRQDTTQEQ